MNKLLFACLLSLCLVVPAQAQMLMGIMGSGKVHGSGTYTQTLTVTTNVANWGHTGTGFATNEVVTGQAGAVIYDTGITFTSINIPQGATIANAVFSVKPNSVVNGTPVIRYHGDDADNSAAVTSYTDGRARARTSQYVTPGTFTLNNFTDTDVTTIVQAIINRAGWASGNRLTIFIDDNGSGNGSYIDGETAAASALLHISIPYSY